MWYLKEYIIPTFVLGFAYERRIIDSRLFARGMRSWVRVSVAGQRRTQVSSYIIDLIEHPEV